MKDLRSKVVNAPHKKYEPQQTDLQGHGAYPRRDGGFSRQDPEKRDTASRTQIGN